MKFARLISVIGMIFLCSSVCSMQSQAAETGKSERFSRLDCSKRITRFTTTGVADNDMGKR